MTLNSFWNSTGFVLISLCNFASSPISYAKLGKISYGIWIFIISTMQYSSVLYFGFGATIITFVAELSAKKDHRGFNRLISLFFTIYSMLGFLTILFSLGVAYLLPVLIKEPVAAEWTYRLPVIITGIQMGLNFPLSVFGAILMGSQNYFFLNVSNFAVSFLNLFFIFLVPTRYCTLLNLAATLFITGFIGFVINFSYIMKIHPTLRISFRDFELKEAKSLFTFSFKSFIILIADRIVSLSDTIVIGIFLGPAAVAFYSVPQRLVAYVQIMTQSASGVLFPKFSELKATGDTQKSIAYWLNGYKLSLALSMPISLLFFFFGETIQRLWMGKDFGTDSRILIILTAAYLFQQPVTRSLLVATNNHGIPSILLIIEAVVNLGLTLIFIHFWGMIGVSIGTFIPCIVIGSFLIPLLSCRIFGVPFPRFVMQAVFPNLAAAVPSVALLWWLRSIGYGGTMFTFLVTAVSASGLFYLCFFGKDIIRLAGIRNNRSSILTP